MALNVTVIGRDLCITSVFAFPPQTGMKLMRTTRDGQERTSIQIANRSLREEEEKSVVHPVGNSGISSQLCPLVDVAHSQDDLQMEIVKYERTLKT